MYVQSSLWHSFLTQVGSLLGLNLDMRGIMQEMLLMEETPRQFGVPRIGEPLRGPYNRDYNMLGSGSKGGPLFGETTI